MTTSPPPPAFIPIPASLFSDMDQHSRHRNAYVYAYLPYSDNVTVTLGASYDDLYLVNDTSNIVQVTGTVTLYFTTVEIEPTNITLVSSGNPELAPQVLSTGGAANSQWEGTYIQTTGTITARRLCLRRGAAVRCCRWSVSFSAFAPSPGTTFWTWRE